MCEDDKRALRACMRVARQALAEEERLRLSAEIFARVSVLKCFEMARRVLGYVSVRGEVETEELLRHCLAQGKEVYLPVVRGGEMQAVRWQGEPLEADAFGIPAPRFAAPGEPDLIFVPGLAFGEDFSRLGQGGGYYDRYAACSDALRVGLCYEFQMFPSLPSAPHDARMHAIVTPARTLFAPQMRKTGQDGA